MKDNKTVIDELKIEKADLDEKVENLYNFLDKPERCSELPSRQLYLLQEQYHYMTTYLLILNERILNLNGIEYGKGEK
ncbi:hypothetical protein FEZ51_02025 [Pediococcus stilesii]|uniref:Uncharacterized protein n=1 Tax=Pediococcus stilesii TaxID=331679 RepID=A0A5R9BXQ5_9LACO|nr:hypothetical protein [Pediococcus stilesii]TLQ05459.1 hypothetical protein FEZ51_02025 [Pediococcus stilesii]